MNLLLFFSFFWILTEILLSSIVRTNDSNNNYDRSSLKILWITICISISLGIILKSPNFAFALKYASYSYYTGISLICVGLIIRWIAILKLKKSFTVNVSVVENQNIIQSGIYKHIRHPSYLGSLLSFCGLAVVFNNWLTFIIIFIPIFFSFMYRIHVEEKLLSQVFGTQYTDYIENSWKLIPKIY